MMNPQIHDDVIKYIQTHEEGRVVAIKAIDKLIRNRDAEQGTYVDKSTLCSSTCSKRSIYEIYTSIGLIRLVKYVPETNDKYFEVIDYDGLLELKEEINKLPHDDPNYKGE